MDMLTRRDFLARGAVAGGAAWLLATPFVTAQEADAPALTGGFRVGIQSNVLNAFSPELEAMVGHIAALGFRWVEFAQWHYGVPRDAGRSAEVQALLARHGLRQEAHFLGEIQANEEHLRAVFAFARANGVSVLIGQPVAEAFPILDALVREFDIKVAIHNYGPGHRFDRIASLLTAAAPWDRRIGYCLDTGHAMRSGEHPVEAVRQLGSRLYAVHLREHAAISRDPQPPETVVGEGALDLPAFCAALREVGFSGPLSLEVYVNPKDPLDALRRSLANVAAAAAR